MSKQDSLAGFRRTVVESARRKILFLPHAIRQMSRLDRMITAQDVRRVVLRGEMIEDYPEDVRGHSCLLIGMTLKEDTFTLCVRRSPSSWRLSRPTPRSPKSGTHHSK